MFFGIVGSSLDKYLNRVEMKSFDAGSLKNMAALSGTVPELKNVIFIPDGDVKNNLKLMKIFFSCLAKVGQKHLYMII
jgi:hypothetical protein